MKILVPEERSARERVGDTQQIEGQFDLELEQVALATPDPRDHGENPNSLAAFQFASLQHSTKVRGASARLGAAVD